jgi:anthranilate phosphoribosyltransferase
MLQLAVQIDLSTFDPMDVCGTGGDGKDTFNISTTSAFVIAGTGQRIAKHGNHGVSSPVGSSTVLEYLGVKFSNEAGFLKQKIETAGICYLHAPLFHPAMRHVGAIRKELGFKTFFNILGPLLNPAKVNRQLTGTYNLATADLYAEVFKRSDSSFAIIHALDGYDEISLTGDFKMITRYEEKILSPADLGLSKLSQEDLHGGNSLEESAKILLKILENKGTKAQTEVVIANAAVALCAANEILGLEEAVSKAKESLESGRALECLRGLIK